MLQFYVHLHVDTMSFKSLKFSLIQAHYSLTQFTCSLSKNDFDFILKHAHILLLTEIFKSNPERSVWKDDKNEYEEYAH